MKPLHQAGFEQHPRGVVFTRVSLIRPTRPKQDHPMFAQTPDGAADPPDDGQRGQVHPWHLSRTATETPARTPESVGAVA
jgi:hypothetical protein